MRPGITSTGTILDRIVQQKIVEITAAESRMPLGALKEAIMQAPTVQDFAGALRRDHIALIAEVKKASPSKGIFLEDFDPVGIASEYEQHGAAAISVLTDERFFQGHLDYLRHVRTQVSIPVLRKDFLIDPYQVYEARAAGADAVLLIVACLEDPVLHDLHALVLELGMAALVEVHNEAEMQRALAVPGIGVIGINNRDLHDFSVDLQTAARLAAHRPHDNIVLVGESGIYSRRDVQALASVGVQAVLVGEALVRAEDRPALIQALSGVPR